MKDKRMKKPGVSVIMPAYNAEKYIGAAIESILEQTFQDWELVIVDDGSTDNTVTVVDRYLNDPRIIFHQNENNLGIAASRNTAMEFAHGKYIAIQDDDDLSLPHRLERETVFLEAHPEIDAVAGYWLMVEEEGDKIISEHEAYKNPKYVKAHLIFSDCIGNGSAMFRRDFVRKNGICYQNGLLGMEDYCFWIGFSKHGNISAVDDIVYKQRRHANQESKKNLTEHIETRRALFAQFQRDALCMYGINLSPQARETMERLAGEKTDVRANAEDYGALYRAFREIIEKAYALRLDFADEIAIACRKHLGKKIANSKGFWLL